MITKLSSVEKNFFDKRLFKGSLASSRAFVVSKGMVIKLQLQARFVPEDLERPGPAGSILRVGAATRVIAAGSSGQRSNSPGNFPIEAGSGFCAPCFRRRPARVTSPALRAAPSGDSPTPVAVGVQSVRVELRSFLRERDGRLLRWLIT